MNKTLEGMARASVDADGCDGDYDKNPHEIREALATDMRRALLWLADNVSDEMVFAAIAPDEPNMAHFKDAFRGTIEGARKEISAALRAAADGGEK